MRQNNGQNTARQGIMKALSKEKPIRGVVSQFPMAQIQESNTILRN